MNKDYLIFHMHSAYSLMDSVVQPESYIEWLKNNGHTSICFTEHGSIGNWIKKKQMADKAGLKYIHGCEVYLTPKLIDDEGKKFRCNYHTILIAKNYEGVKEINRLVSIATDEEHMYYKPRISYDEFFNISNNVIKISACLGSPLFGESFGSEVFNKLVEAYDFIEIQYHNEPRQIEFNKMLAKLGKTLVAGTDTHSITQYDQECRSILMKAKGLEDDESSFDLRIKTYDEVIEMFKIQGALDTDIVRQALDNTLIIQNMVEDFELDYSFKYPSNYEDEESLLRSRCYDKIKEMGFDNRYIDRVEEEISAFKKVNMMGFMLINGDMADYCKENKIVIGYGRGSVGGSLIAYLLGVTDVDAIKWNTNFARFCNESRISLGDIDWDISPEDRQYLFDLIKERSGKGMSCHIGTFGKLSTKSIVDNVGRALNKSLDELAKIKNGYADIEKEQSIIERRFDNGAMSEKEYEREIGEINKKMEDYLSQFSDIFYYYKGLNGVMVSQGAHAAGIIGSPISVIENIGTRYDQKSKRTVSVCDMKNVDSVNFVKFDMLSLKTLQVVKHTYEMIGMAMPKAHMVDWNDKAVYDSIATSPIGLFQFEAQNAHLCLSKLKPSSVEEIALMSAVLRPSCDSFREKLISREINPSPSDTIANMMKPTMGYMVYQEQQIQFLQELCGFSGSEADTIRRYIGKKDFEALERSLPEIEKGYISNSEKDESVAREEVMEFIQVMKDSGAYGFNYSHALAYSMLTYMTAYLRHYYPVEFTTSYLNNASNEDDIINGTELANLLNIKIKNPEFGASIGKYSIKDGVIYKGVESVLYVSEVCANDLYSLHSTVGSMSFSQVLAHALALKSTDTRKIRTLIRIGYFSKYGKALKLDKFFDYFEKYNGKKQIKKEGIPSGTKKLVERLLDKEEQGFTETKSLYKIDSIKLLEEMFKCIKDEDFKEEQKIAYEIGYLGYVQSDIKSDIATVKYLSTKNSSYFLEYKGGKGKWFKLRDGLEPLSKDDIVMIHGEAKGYIVSYTKIEKI